jgi:CBS-domain-containing membrane protein
MFLRDRTPRDTERKVARGIRLGHFIGIVVFSALLNIVVASHLIVNGPSTEWLWLPVGGIAILLFASGGLLWVIRRQSPR